MQSNILNSIFECYHSSKWTESLAGRLNLDDNSLFCTAGLLSVKQFPTINTRVQWLVRRTSPITRHTSCDGMTAKKQTSLWGILIHVIHPDDARNANLISKYGRSKTPIKFSRTGDFELSWLRFRVYYCRIWSDERVTLAEHIRVQRQPYMTVLTEMLFLAQSRRADKNNTNNTRTDYISVNSCLFTLLLKISVNYRRYLTAFPSRITEWF